MRKDGHIYREGDAYAPSDAPDFAVEQADRYERRFFNRFRDKFIDGQAEHDTHLENDNTLSMLLDHLEDELLDSWSYIQAMRAKVGL
jgi:hypothetical protein